MRLALLAAMLLPSCAAQTPAEGTAMIEVSSGNYISTTRTRIYADGTVMTETSGSGKTRTGHLIAPDAFAAAAAVIATEGVATRAAHVAGEEVCMDYGTDLVRAVPPIAGFDLVATQCPDPAINALMSHVLASIAQP